MHRTRSMFCWQQFGAEGVAQACPRGRVKVQECPRRPGRAGVVWPSSGPCVHVHSVQPQGGHEDVAHWPPLESCEVWRISGSPEHTLHMVWVHLKQDLN